MRIGVVHHTRGLGRSATEQLLGVRLAAAHTREASDGAARSLEIIERPFTADSELPKHLGELVGDTGCDALLGILPVPLSVQAAEWAEAAGVLYATGNNNPKVGNGRHSVFHIGVPSEVTAEASMAYLRDERGVSRVTVLHTPGEFHVHAAECMVEAAGRLGMDAATVDIGLEPDRDDDVARSIEDHGSDAVCVMGSELDRIVQLVPTLNRLGGDTRVLLSRGMVCREFAERCGAVGEGYGFIDIYLRSDEAPAEEGALMDRVAAADANLVTTASHGFGWDLLRLLAAALANGPGLDDQVAYLESAGPLSGATGILRFDASDHNGRRHDNPTTIARLAGGRFVPASKLAR
jgi:ABC-type branched-subunit amino acid transport system substrate-binding protein